MRKIIDLTFFNRIFFRFVYNHASNRIFKFGISFSDCPQEFLFINEKGSEEYIDLMETGFDIWLGVISFHCGYRESF